MASVWKRLQRVNKRAAKFQYTASYHRIDLETSAKWKPNKLSVVWTRRSRRVISEPQEWEPSLKDPLKGSVLFTLPENHTVAVTLFKDSRSNELEDKDWTFVLEDVSSTGKRRRLAQCSINMRKYASLEPAQRSLSLQFEPTTHKITAASIQLTLHCVLLREGHATDEDMQSLASLLSVNNNSDIAVLDDLDEDDYTLSDHSTRQMLDLRQQVEEMTQSLTNSDIAATPNSVQSLALDSLRTPVLSPGGEPATPSNYPDLKITEEKEKDIKDKDKEKETQNEKAKSRPEFLANLTKLAMKEPPKFASTLKPSNVVASNNEIGIKGITFKTNTVVRSESEEDNVNSVIDNVTHNVTATDNDNRSDNDNHNDIDVENLKPLDLKLNLNNISLDKNDNEEEDADRTPTAGPKLIADRLEKDKTPVQDLLEWCQSVTGEYKCCKVTNLTTSFRSGLAFCAIIHRYRPHLIDFSGLQPDDAEKNVRIALEASSKLGISQVLTVADVCSRPTPDRLAIMTYLFQLRAHFTGNELQVEQLGNDETESSYLVGRHDTDGSLPPELFSREVSTRRSRNLDNKPKQRALTRPRPVSQGSIESNYSTERSTPEKPSSPTTKDSFLAQSKSMFNKILSSPNTREKPTAKWFTPSAPARGQEPIPPKPEKLMTRKELTDPFGSDEEEEPTPQYATIHSQKQTHSQTNTQTQIQTQIHTQTNTQTQIQTQIHSQTNTQTQIQSQTQTSNAKDTPVTEQNGFDAATTPPPMEATTQSPQFDPLGVLQSPIQTQPEEPLPSLQITENPRPITPELPKPTPQLLSRHDELKERARLLLEQTKREAREKARKQKEKEDSIRNEAMNGMKNGELSPSKKPVSEEERQAILRERARKLIADARAGVISPTAPLSPARAPRGTVEIISKQSVMEEIAAAGGLEQMDALLSRADSIHSNSSHESRKSSLSPARSEEQNSEETKSVKSESAEEEKRSSDGAGRRTPLQSFSAIIERLTPDKDNLEGEVEPGSYIQSELEALEREQAAIDERAAALEKQLRQVMQCPDNTEEEDRLMSQWFNLVNKKNALLRRQMQLNILEQEEDLSRRCELLARELRLSLGVDDWRKTPGQKRRERLLLQELVSAVNERDRLVQEMDEQEKAIAEDAEIEHNLSQVEIQRKNNCILQ